jgi:hypothetical protein
MLLELGAVLGALTVFAGTIAPTVIDEIMNPSNLRNRAAHKRVNYKGICEEFGLSKESVKSILDHGKLVKKRKKYLKSLKSNKKGV